MKRWIFLAMVLLSACAKKDNDPAGVIVPEDLPFNEKALPPINDQDFAHAQLVAKKVGQAAESQSQILIKKDQSNYQVGKRERKLRAMSPDAQRLIRSWQADCPPNHQKTGAPLQGKPRKGGSTRALRRIPPKAIAAPL